MYFFFYNGNEYRVRVTHDQGRVGLILRKWKGKTVPYKGVTVAALEQRVGTKDWKTVEISSAFRSASDLNFSRRVGRQIALTRIPFQDKAFRRAMFEAVYK